MGKLPKKKIKDSKDGSNEKIVQPLDQRITRRQAISGMAATGSAAIAGLVIGGAAGYLAGSSAAGPAVTKTVTQTATQTQTVSQTQTGPLTLKQGSGVFKIGGGVSTSGPTAPAISKEVDMYAAMENLINARGGVYAEKMGGYVPVKIVVYQDGGPPDLATIKANYTKMATQDKVDIMLGPLTAAPAETASAVAIQYGIPYIDNQAEEVPIYTQPGAGDWVVSTINIINYWLWNYLNVLKAQTNAKTIAFIDQGDDFSTEVNGTGPSKFGGIQFANALGFKVVDSESANTTFSQNYDYTGLVQKMKSLDPDVIIYSETIGVFEALFWKACKAASYHPRAYHAISGALDAFQGTTGTDLGSGISGEVYWDPSFPYEGLWGKNFWQAVQTKANFADIHWPWVTVGYSAVEIACAAVQNAGTTDKAAVMNALKSMEITTLIGRWKAQYPLKLPFPPPAGLNTGAGGMTTILGTPVQVINGKRTIIGPPEIATGKYVYPEPFTF